MYHSLWFWGTFCELPLWVCIPRIVQAEEILIGRFSGSQSIKRVGGISSVEELCQALFFVLPFPPECFTVHRTQFELNYLRDSALIFMLISNHHYWKFIRIIFALENGVMTTSKNRSILPALIFTCFWKLIPIINPRTYKACGEMLPP